MVGVKVEDGVGVDVDVGVYVAVAVDVGVKVRVGVGGIIEKVQLPNADTNIIHAITKSVFLRSENIETSILATQPPN